MKTVSTFAQSPCSSAACQATLRENFVRRGRTAWNVAVRSPGRGASATPSPTTGSSAGGGGPRRRRPRTAGGRGGARRGGGGRRVRGGSLFEALNGKTGTAGACTTGYTPLV